VTKVNRTIVRPFTPRMVTVKVLKISILRGQVLKISMFAKNLKQRHMVH